MQRAIPVDANLDIYIFLNNIDFEVILKKILNIVS